MCSPGHIGVLVDELLRFNIEPHYSDMCVYHRCPQTLPQKYVETWVFVAVSGLWPLGENTRGSSY